MFKVAEKYKRKGKEHKIEEDQEEAKSHFVAQEGFCFAAIRSLACLVTRDNLKIAL